MTIAEIPAAEIKDPDMTPEFFFTRGVFDRGAGIGKKAHLPPAQYYLIPFPLSHLDNLLLVDEIPGSAEWSFEAIFQRDIDVERVEQELLEGYLENEDKAKFFPPLTIALLPYRGWNSIR